MHFFQDTKIDKLEGGKTVNTKTANKKRASKICFSSITLLKLVLIKKNYYLYLVAMWPFLEFFKDKTKRKLKQKYKVANINITTKPAKT